MHTSRGTVLIIDDKEKLCEILSQDFQNIGYRPLYATTSERATKLFIEEKIDVVLLDLKLGAEDGLTLLKEFVARERRIPVVIMTGYATIESAVEAVKLGAYDYVQKPIPFAKVQRVMENALKSSRLEDENQALKERLTESTAKNGSLNQTIRALHVQLGKIATTDIPVLLIGESGTGKELLAEYIHNQSARASRRLYKINSASLPPSLLDNELFGHEKGAYTGADSLYKGIFEQAEGSTLFLDEIGDMPLEIQAKILRTLQNREVRRLGGKETLQVDVRFIAATNRDIQELVATGRFREDLFYRLNAAMFHIPALRERKEDIPILAANFLSEIAPSGRKRLGDEVLELFDAYTWPGNIRELKNVVNFAAAMSSDREIGIGDLPPYLVGGRQHGGHPLADRGLDKELIQQTLMQTRYNKTRTAELLKISRRTLYNKMGKYGLK